MGNEKQAYITNEELYEAFNDRQISSLIRRLKEHQIVQIEKFRDYLILRGLRKATVVTALFPVSKLLSMTGKSGDELEKEDIERFFLSVSNLNQTSRFKYFKNLRCFLQWVGKEDLMKGMEIRNCLNLKLPEEILTSDEIKQMIQVALNFRDKALVFALYETAARSGELLNMKIKHVTFDKYGGVVILPKGKTVSRRIRIIDSVPDLKKWLESHPGERPFS